MNLKHYLIVNFSTMLLAWLVWLFILFSIDPFVTSWLGRTLFYLSLFTAVFSTLSLLGFIGRFSLIKQKMAHQAVITAFRQSALVALGLIVTLWLLSRQLFSWFNLIILASGLVMLEFFILSCQPKSTDHQLIKSVKNTAASEDIISSTFKEY